MTIYIITIYFSLMFSLISIIKLIPFTKGDLNTLIIRFFLCIANILSVLFLTASIKILPVSIIVITIIFTEGHEYLKNYMTKHFIRLIRSDSFLLKLNLVLTFNTNAFGFLEMVKAVKFFDNNENIKGEEVLSVFTKKVNNDLIWASNCMIFLSNIHQNKIAYSLLQSISIDLAKENLPYQYLHIAIRLYCDNNDFEIAEIYLNYIETHYYDAQHKFTNIQAFLYYYAKGGNEQLFNKMIEDFPEVTKFPILPDLRKILFSSEEKLKIFKEPKSYLFNMVKGENNKILPLYIFAGIICAITLIQLVFSVGGSIADRVFSGHLFPIEYIRFGAAAKSLIFDGEWIRLITPVFLHAGLLHLVLNIYGLVNIGRVLLRFFDKFVLLFIFAGGAVIGNVVSLFFSSALLSVGASGGVFSILGALFLYLLWHRNEINKIVFHKIIVNFAVILAIQIIFGLQNSNIDNFAHIGGFLGGILLTGLSLWIKETNFQKIYLNIVKIILFLTSISLLVLWPRMFTQNQFEKSVLIENISEMGIEYSIPATWKKESDRYIDILSNGQILFHVVDGPFRLSDQIMAIKELYTKDDKYKVHKESVLNDGWRSLEFISKDSQGTYNLYFFCKNAENKIIEVYLFLNPDLYDRYLPFFETVLYSVK